MTGAILESLSGESGGAGLGGGEAAKSTAGADPRFGDGSTPADLPKPKPGSKLDGNIRAWRTPDMVSTTRTHHNRFACLFAHAMILSRVHDVILCDASVLGTLPQGGLLLRLRGTAGLTR